MIPEETMENKASVVIENLEETPEDTERMPVWDLLETARDSQTGPAYIDLYPQEINVLLQAKNERDALLDLLAKQNETQKGLIMRSMAFRISAFEATAHLLLAEASDQKTPAFEILNDLLKMK